MIDREFLEERAKRLYADLYALQGAIQEVEYELSVLDDEEGMRNEPET